MSPADPVGMIEIAALLGVVEKTVHTWRFRQILPAPDFASVNGNAAWQWQTILGWAGTTGHLKEDGSAGKEAARQYRELFGQDPVPHRKGGRIVNHDDAPTVVESPPPKRPRKAAAAAPKKTAAKRTASTRKS